MPEGILKQDNSIAPDKLRIIQRNGERIVMAAFYGPNRPVEFVQYQQRVFAHFAIPINHVFTEFPRCSHGTAVDEFLRQIDHYYDYFILFDTDAIPIRQDFVDIACEKIRDKRTVFGVAQQSNHISVNGSVNHIYAGPAAFAISHQMYIALRRPTFAETRRSDCAEEITWAAEELGFNICIMFPSHVHEKRWKLGNGHEFGIGTTYGDCVFHAFVQTDEKSKMLFVQQCEKILTRTPSPAQ